MLRVLGLLVVLVYTFSGVVMMASAHSAGGLVAGLFLVVTGLAWLLLDALRRRKSV